MRRLTKLACTKLMIAIFLMCVGAVIAALDELARVPFYRTLPVSAAIVNTVAIVVALRKRRQMLSFRWSPTMSARRLQAVLGKLPFSVPTTRAEPSAATIFNLPDVQRSTSPSAQQAKQALSNLHSVVWMPAGDIQTKNLISHEEVIDHETR